jgi:hypothetical protein
MEHGLVLLLDFKEDYSQPVVYFEGSHVRGLDALREHDIACCYCELIRA